MKKMKEKKVVVAVEASALAGNGMSRLSLSLSLSFSRARARWSDRPWIPFVLLSGWINLHLSAVLAGLLLHGLPVHIDDAWRTEREREREREDEKSDETRGSERKKKQHSPLFFLLPPSVIYYIVVFVPFFLFPRVLFFAPYWPRTKRKTFQSCPSFPSPPPSGTSQTCPRVPISDADYE